MPRTFFNPSILYPYPTHYDKVNMRYVKVYQLTQAKTLDGRVCWSADIMDGEHSGKGTTVFESEIIDIRHNCKR